MTPETRHILFDFAIRLNKTTYEAFAENIGVSRQAVSQALTGRIKSQPILARVDEYITENLPRIKELTGNGLEIGAYHPSEHSPTALLLRIISDNEAVEVKKDWLAKVLDTLTLGNR